MTRRTLVGLSFALFTLVLSLVASSPTSAAPPSVSSRVGSPSLVAEYYYLSEIANLRVGRDDLYFVNATLDGPCPYGQNLPAASPCGRTEVFVISFDTVGVSSPVITLGIGKPNNDGVFAPGAVTTTLLLAPGVTHHELILYPTSPDFKLFEPNPIDGCSGYSQACINHWNETYLTIRNYDKAVPTAPAAIVKASGYVQYNGSGFIQV